MAAHLTIRPMTLGDAAAVLAIYQSGLDAGNASFEVTAPTWDGFDTTRLPAHRFVAAGPDGGVLGWVAVTPVSTRQVYAGVVEHSVYVDPAAQGRGAGLGAARRADPLHRGGRDLDHPVRRLPGEPRVT